MRKLFVLMIIISLLITSSVSLKAQNMRVVFYIGSEKYLKNNSLSVHDAPPYIKNGTTFVPIRFIAENLGMEVSFNEADYSVDIKGAGKEIKIFVGKRDFFVNGEKKTFTQAPELKSGRVFVPIRAVAESLSINIFYDDNLIVLDTDKIELDNDTDNNYRSILTSSLPVAGTMENLKALLVDVSNANYRILYKAAGGTTKALLQSEGTTSNVADYSKTNVQVEGVDEGDIVKCDGEYIYKVQYDKLFIVKAYPAQSMEIIYEYPFEKSFFPEEIYVDEENLVLIGIKPANSLQYTAETEVFVFDIKNKDSIEITRHFSIEGHYLNSRKIDSSLYVLANQSIYDIDNIKLPEIYDDKFGKSGCTVENLKYFPNFTVRNFLTIGAIDLSKDEPLYYETYLGAGEEIYASLENLYVAVNNPKTRNTSIYKFSLQKGKVTYLACGEFEGSLLNQFSMDEYEGYLRVAFTKGTFMKDSTNGIVTFDPNMNVAGILEGLAEGEKIYSARFLGDKGYVVTFKKVDPLFVFDLSDPYDPKILGELKIPGYSDYLHPYDENHIIGFGKDAIDNPNGDNAYYQGMKISVFDVSDFENPKEIFTEYIGDRGTDSPVLSNHKALLESKEKGIIAFPVLICEIPPEKREKATITTTGVPTFCGALVYDFNLDSGFTLKGRIAHDDIRERKYYYVNRYLIERLIYIGDTLYAISQNAISAHDLGTLEEVSRISLQ